MLVVESICSNEAYEHTFCATHRDDRCYGLYCCLERDHAGDHASGPMVDFRRYADPRGRSRSTVSARGPTMLKPFLIEAAVDKRWSLRESGRWPAPEFSLHSIAAMCDEDGTEDDLLIQVGGARGTSDFKFDRKYLAHIWPDLFHPPGDKIMVAGEDDLIVRVERRAIVVLVGVGVH